MCEWLADHLNRIVEGLNRCGHWSFSGRVEATDPMAARRTNPVAVVSLHRGVARRPCRRPAPGASTTVVLFDPICGRPDGLIQRWFDTYGFRLPANRPPARYEF